MSECVTMRLKTLTERFLEIIETRDFWHTVELKEQILKLLASGEVKP